MEGSILDQGSDQLDESFILYSTTDAGRRSSVSILINALSSFLAFVNQIHAYKF